MHHLGGRLRLLAFVGQLLAWLGLTFEKNISREAGCLGGPSLGQRFCRGTCRACE
jgi:hypothetical protein